MADQAEEKVASGGKRRRKKKRKAAAPPAEPPWWPSLLRAVAALEHALSEPVEGAGDGPDEDTTLPSAAAVEVGAPPPSNDIPVPAEGLPTAEDVARQPPKRTAPALEVVPEPAEDAPPADWVGDPRAALLERATPAWPVLEALHDDVHRLFRMGDVAGALVSLERLVILAGREARVDAFLERNEERLMALFERVFDGLDKVVEATDGEAAFEPDFTGLTKVARLVGEIDGKRSVQELIDAITVPPVEVACLLHHLLRTRRARIAS